MFNPAIASENIKHEFIDYITTTYSFADASLRKQFYENLTAEVSKGPFLEIKDVFASGKSISELIDEDVLSPLFNELEAGKPERKLYKKCLPISRRLYQHQVEAIRTISSGNNAVISTGTGSGKTNCFLIPVINKLLREKEAGTLGKGVRALFIYPMNALANDQMKNIRNILMYYPDITFGVYNGGTENEEEKAIAVYEAMFANEAVPELRHRLPNEILSRDEMKNTPPNILFTNYAMLEHLLFRPKDDVLFSHADFSFVVLDEAHIYTGATGIETSILLRRLQARIASKNGTQFILTSATLGSDESSDDDIVAFATNLCGVPFCKENIIRATREKYVVPLSVIHYPSDLYNELADERNRISDVLSKYGLHFEGTSEAEILYDFLSTTDLYTKLRQSISEISGMSEIQGILGLNENTAISFISLCTRAQKNGKALIDARYHFFLRCLEGAFLSLLPSKKLSLTRQKYYFENTKQYPVFEVSVCDECGKIAFVGKVENKHLVQTSKLQEKVDFYYFAEDKNNDFEDDDDSIELNDSKEETFFLCPICGAIVAEDEVHNPPCDCGTENYIKVIKARHLQIGSRCGNCHRGTYKRFYLGNEAATGVIATALYEELPEITYEESDESSTKTNNPFAKAVFQSKKNPKKTGRQFLAFSDSRQEAAKFACYLGRSYDEFLRRRGICQLVNEIVTNEASAQYTISDYVNKLTNYFTSKKSFASSNIDESNLTVNSKKNAWVAMLNELARNNSSTSLTSLGIIQFSYAGNTPEIIENLADQYNVSKENIKSLLDLLVFEIVKTGAIVTDGDSDIDDNDREYIFYTSSQRFITYLQSPDKKRNTVTDWAPRNKADKANEYYKTNKMYYVCNTLGIGEAEAAEFLKNYFEYMTNPQMNAFCMKDVNKDNTYVMPAKYFNVLVYGNPNAKWYKCQKCGKVSQFVFNGKCSSARCDGTVVEITPDELREHNHFSNLYYSDRMSPLFIKEHTAQLSKKESAEYQEQFVKKEINALSCSTTFEMGVDVGDLETVFLRDVPPMPSNYAQRAGRAGRSVNAAAYALTYAKLSSHDLSYFKEPQKMIGGIIQPPLFKVDNEKIVRRHVYAIALSMFFAEHEELYDHNKADKFINEKGYTQFIDWISSKPDRLKDMIKRSIPDIDHLHNRIGVENFGWIEEFSGNEGVFTQLITEYENNIHEFEKQISKLKKEDLTKASICERKMQNYMSNKLMDFLARGNILPRYGFPVDTVELQQNATASNISKLRLSRDLQVAIAEYAPSSEVIADGKLYTSRYIKKAQIGTNKQDWHTAYIGICDNPLCETVNYSIVPITSSGVKCSACGKKLQSYNFSESIEPRSGFVTERTVKEVPMTRQEKNYRSEDYYIGNVSAKTIEKYFYIFNGIQLKVESTTNDSLLVKSTNNFYVCPKCGFAYAADEHFGDKEAEKEMAKKQPPLKIITSKAHESLYSQTNCDCKELNRRTLHHVFNTDVAKITFGCPTNDYKTMISVMYAILYAISSELNIERKDIKACLSLHIINKIAKYSIIIYDAVPGGAGHSRRLVTDDGKMLYRIFNSALRRVSSCNCDPSCYNCLRSYENQKIHDDLNRNLAKKFLAQFIGDVKLINEDEATEFIIQTNTENDCEKE